MIIHRPLMLSKSEAAIILAASSQCNVPISLRMKINKFIDREFADVESFDILPPTKSHVERTVYHQSRCVRVPIKTYVDKKPRLKPVPVDKIEVGDVIVCVYYGSQIFNAVVVRRYSINGCQYMEVTSAKKEPGSLNVAYALREFSSPSCILYKVLDHGSC